MVKRIGVALLLTLLVAGSASARDSTIAVAAGGNAKPSVAAQKSGAAAVVNRFYGWLFRTYSTQYGPQRNLSFWVPARDLLDDGLYSMLDKNQRSQPRPDPNHPVDDQCSVLDLLGTTQMYDKLARFAVGTPNVRGDTILVQVTSWRTTDGRSPYPFTMSVTVRYAAGGYRIYDIRQLGHGLSTSIRDDLVSNSRNPNCGWATVTLQRFPTTAPHDREQPAVTASTPPSYAKAKGAWGAVVFGALRPDDLTRYSILKARIEEVRHLDKVARPAMPAVFRIAKKRVKNQVDLVFLSIVGGQWCGSLGCAVGIYADEGGGYRPAGGFVTSAPMYLSETRATLLVCNGIGRPPAEWILKNHAFVWRAPYTAADRPC